MTTEPSDYDRGHIAGGIEARLAGHDKHFADINGSIKELVGEVHALVGVVQGLRDAAEADRQTVKVTAEALEKAAQARETHWSPFTRLIAVVVMLAAIAGVVIAWTNRPH
jgi:t-SNARE complex subunit (syntaxin)